MQIATVLKVFSVFHFRNIFWGVVSSPQGNVLSHSPHSQAGHLDEGRRGKTLFSQPLTWMQTILNGHSNETVSHHGGMPWKAAPSGVEGQPSAKLFVMLPSTDAASLGTHPWSLWSGCQGLTAASTEHLGTKRKGRGEPASPEVMFLLSSH